MLLEQLNWEDADLLMNCESAHNSLLKFTLKEQRASLTKECSDLKNQKQQLDAKRAVVEAEVCESKNTPRKITSKGHNGHVTLTRQYCIGGLLSRSHRHTSRVIVNVVESLEWMSKASMNALCLCCRIDRAAKEKEC